MNLSQFSMNFDISPDCQINIKCMIMALIIQIRIKNANPYSNIEFATNMKNAAVENIFSTQQIRKIIFIKLNVRCFWFVWDGKMPKIWWHFWNNWNNWIESAMVRIDCKLIPNRPFGFYLFQPLKRICINKNIYGKSLKLLKLQNK